MGYRHRWGRLLVIEQETYDAIREDFVRLIPALERKGVRLGDGSGHGKPLFTADDVQFNGLCGCRCLPALAPGLEYRPDDGRFPARWPVERLRQVKHWTGYDVDWGARGCGRGGGCFNTFDFPRLIEQETPNGRVLDECKTNRRCYDLAVMCFLVVAKHHFGEVLQVYSDARERWWDEPRELCQRVLGYGEGMPVGEPWDETERAVSGTG